MHRELSRTIIAVMADIESSLFFSYMGIQPGPTISTANDAPEIIPSEHITAAIDFEGDVHGGLCLIAPPNMAICLANAFGQQYNDRLNSNVRDALAELANMISGAVKSQLSGSLLKRIRRTTPRILLNSRINMNYSTSEHMMRQYFIADKNQFFVDVYY
ncbi:MAG: chemotaxis protein CheX [Magnetococcales bacterium]|nr:chemotaxis protein CheX [Magnetococcales bacterium]